MGQFFLIYYFPYLFFFFFLKKLNSSSSYLLADDKTGAKFNNSLLIEEREWTVTKNVMIIKSTCLSMHKWICIDILKYMFNTRKIIYIRYLHTPYFGPDSLRWSIIYIFDYVRDILEIKINCFSKFLNSFPPISVQWSVLINIL